jgi:hypothetical protein
MDTWKDVLSLVGAIVGLLTALVPLVARIIDMKKRAVPAADPPETPRQIVRPQPVGLRTMAVEVSNEEVPYVLPAGRDRRQIERARGLVKAPAISLLVAGFLGLVFNVVVAGFGFVDQFVTPLSTQTQERQNTSRAAAMQAFNNPTPADHDGKLDAKTEKSDPATAVLTIVMLLSFSVACVMAIWAGFNMVNLRSYWLSMAGSFAIMPGACFCCVAGVPIGIWSLVVLLNPEVRSSFQ